MARPPARMLALALGFLFTVIVLYLNLGSHTAPHLNNNTLSTSVDDLAHVSPDMQKEEAIMGHIGNETLKADLGRAAWKLFHTTMASFPDQPSEDESTALKSYIYLFARLYPCGECASHFQKILKHFPPQTSSRSTAAAWGCHVHNEVNKSKAKPIFDCTKIGDFYDCGCGDNGNRSSSEPERIEEPSELSKDNLLQDGKDTIADHFDSVQIAKEGPTNGG